jgi:hypothetical protein
MKATARFGGPFFLIYFSPSANFFPIGSGAKGLGCRARQVRGLLAPPSLLCKMLVRNYDPRVVVKSIG